MAWQYDLDIQLEAEQLIREGESLTDSRPHLSPIGTEHVRHIQDVVLGQICYQQLIGVRVWPHIVELKALVGIKELTRPAHLDYWIGRRDAVGDLNQLSHERHIPAGGDDLCPLFDVCSNSSDVIVVEVACNDVPYRFVRDPACQLIYHCARYLGVGRGVNDQQVF